MSRKPLTGNSLGIALMIFAMGGFAIEDLLVKLTAATMPISQLLFLMGLAGAGFFQLLALRSGNRGIFSKRVLAPAVMLRNISEMGGTATLYTALAIAPLTMVTAIAQALPLSITLCAALFLGEKVGWRRWTAIAIGFIGVMIVIRPGPEGFQPAALLALVAIGFYTARDLSTRRTPADIDSLQVAGWGMSAIAVMGLVMTPFSAAWIIPSALVTLYIVAAIIAACVAYWALTIATRMSEASVTTPFRYTRLIFAMFLGMIFLGERPDLWTWIGSAIIVASGLYTLARERKLAQTRFAD